MNKITFRIIAILIIGALLFSKSIFSQAVYSNKEASAFSFTIGLTSSKLYRDTIPYESGIFANSGFIYSFAFSDKSNLGIEAIFSVKSVKRSSPIIKYRFYYMDFPIYYQYKFNDNIRANIGIQYSRLVNSKVSNLDGLKAQGVNTRPYFTNLNDDYGILAGFECDVLPRLFLSVRYSISANSFLINTDPYFGVFQFSVNYKVYKGYRKLFHSKSETK